MSGTIPPLLLLCAAPARRLAEWIRPLKNLIERWKYGTLFEAFQYRLESAGIIIAPYYWIEEGVQALDPRRLAGGFEDYTFGFFGPEEIKRIAAGESGGRAEDDMLARLESGQKCFGATCHGEIAAFMWIDLAHWFIRRHSARLAADEAYLFDMYTLKPFRGKGIAPYLRYQSYQTLREMGKNRFFSYSDYFNHPSIRFKQKLNARFLKTCLYVELFNRFHWNWTLRNHSCGGARR
jgi:GNAT superfamily N-acetyltransferase